MNPTPKEIVDAWFDDALFRDALPHSYDRILEDVRAAVEAEREACAKVCENGGMVNGNYYANRIRARGESDE